MKTKIKKIFGVLFVVLLLLIWWITKADKHFVSCDLEFKIGDNIIYENNNSQKVFRFNTKGSLLFYTDPANIYFGLDNYTGLWYNSLYVNRKSWQDGIRDVSPEIHRSSLPNNWLEFVNTSGDKTILWWDDGALNSNRFIAYDGFQAGCSDSGWKNELTNNWNRYDYTNDPGTFYPQPLCWNENGKVYAWNETSWDTQDFCTEGTVNPSNPIFPDEGETRAWTCTAPSHSPVTCSARRETESPNDCTGPDWAIIAHGDSRTYYKNTVVDGEEDDNACVFGESTFPCIIDGTGATGENNVCEEEVRVCTNWVLSWTYTETECLEDEPEDCVEQEDICTFDQSNFPCVIDGPSINICD